MTGSKRSIYDHSLRILAHRRTASPLRSYTLPFLGNSTWRYCMDLVVDLYIFYHVKMYSQYYHTHWTDWHICGDSDQMHLSHNLHRPQCSSLTSCRGVFHCVVPSQWMGLASLQLLASIHHYRNIRQLEGLKTKDCVPKLLYPSMKPSKRILVRGNRALCS